MAPCVLCKAPGAMVCESCHGPERVDGNGNTVHATWYCSYLCMDIDEPAHRMFCFSMTSQKANEDLFERAKKAGEIAQELFYLFSEQAWTYDMESVRVVRNLKGALVEVEVVVGEGLQNGPAGVSTCNRTGGGWLIEFPKEAFKGIDRDAKEALLASGNSVMAFVFMRTAVHLLFEDLVNDADTDILEVAHLPPADIRHLVKYKAPGRRIVGARADQLYDEEGVKGVYEITLKSGQKVALDLAGAGHSTPHITVLDWMEYWYRSGSAIKHRCPFRLHLVLHFGLMHQYQYVSPQSIILELSNAFEYIIADVKQRSGLQMTDTLYSGRSFHKEKEALITHVRDSLQAYIAHLDRGRSITLSSGIMLPRTSPGINAHQWNSTKETYLLSSVVRPVNSDVVLKALTMPGVSDSVKYRAFKLLQKNGNQHLITNLLYGADLFDQAQVEESSGPL